MIGKRLLQLVVHALLMVVCIVTNIINPFKYRFQWLDLLGIMILVILIMILWGSVKLNWQFIKLQKISIKTPSTLWLHYAFIPLTIIIIYFAQLLRFYYDSHLSSYNLTITIPGWVSLLVHLQNFNTAIATTDLGIYVFLFYTFIISLIVTMQFLGLFTTDQSIRASVIISRPLLWSQITLGTLLVILVLLFEYKLCRNIFSFVVWSRMHPDLLNTWNIGNYFFESVHVILLSLYAVWIFYDGIELWKTKGI